MGEGWEGLLFTFLLFLLLIRQCVQIEHRAKEHNQREDDHDAAHHTIDDEDAALVELAAHLVYEPRQTKPPQHSTKHYACITYRHLQRTLRHHKGKLSKEKDEEEDDKRIGECHQERREAVVHQRALLRFVAPMNILRRVGAIAVDAKQQQYNTATYLKHKTRTLVAHKIHDKTHTDTRKQRIYKVADTSTDTRNKTIPATFIQSSLYAKHPHRTHRSRCHDANQYSMEYKV